MVTETTSADLAAARLEQARDLRGQISELQTDPEAEKEVVFKETSTVRRKLTLYSMVDGEPIRVPTHLAQRALDKRLPAGGFMFTSDPAQAPQYRLGEVKCFLHPEAPEREVVVEIGLGEKMCMSAHLANRFSKRIHGQHRHKQEWLAYRDYIEESQRTEEVSRANKQLDATLALAAAAARQTGATPATTAVPVRMEEAGDEAS